MLENDNILKFLEQNLLLYEKIFIYGYNYTFIIVILYFYYTFIIQDSVLIIFYILHILSKIFNLSHSPTKTKSRVSTIL
jgi:hypothetical protein